MTDVNGVDTVSYQAREKIESWLISNGADFVGVADVQAFGDSPKAHHPSQLLKGANSVLVFGRRFLRSSVATERAEPYTLVRNFLSRSLDALSIELCYFLENEFGCLAVPTGTISPCTWDAQTQKSRGAISLKHAAELAGLGQVGKNTLLISPTYGNMIWLAAVVTDMSIKTDVPPEENLCPPGCELCINACPADALQKGDPSMDQRKCWDYAFKNPDREEFRIVCRTCRTICPMEFGVKG